MYENYKPKFTEWNEEDYKSSKLRYCEPMTAHALETEEDQISHLSDPENYIEEKFDGTRATCHFEKGGVRVFSRRISKKTNWFTENTDSLPHIHEIDIPELYGSVIDGEIFIPNRPFKDISATLNCIWDKAIERQNELGFAVLHTFDILYYNGVSVKHMKLKDRKVLLRKLMSVLEKHGIKCIEEVKYYPCGTELFDPKKYYESIVARGGEGVIIKNKNGIYEHKRSKAFLKIKKFYTRECILLNFSEPTKYYDGKFPDDHWDYWETPDGANLIMPSHSAKKLIKQGYKPLTRYYYNKWKGNMIFGVIIANDDIPKLDKKKEHVIEDFHITDECGDEHIYKVLVVGECSGFDDEVRKHLSDSDKGRVIEVKCNEIFKDTGKMRHPRFLRFRDDKSVYSCNYRNHIEEGV